MEEGWIKVYRKMKEWTWFNDRYTLHLFMYLLLSVNREDGECNGIKVKAGSLVTNLQQLSETLDMSRNYVKKSVRNLIETGELEVETRNANSRWSIYTIKNWSKYQSQRQNTAVTPCQSNHDGHGVTVTPCQSNSDGHSDGHSVTINAPLVDSNSNINIKIQEENKKSACAYARDDVPSEWTKLANDLWNAYPRKQDMIPSLSAVIRAIEREGDFGTFKALATAAVAKFAEITAKWKQADRRYIPKMSTFFDNASYRDDPSSWERNDKPSHGGYDFTGMKPVTQEEIDGTTEVF